MSTTTDQTRRQAIVKFSSSFRWLWTHFAAGVGAALILVALWIGYKIGQPAGTHDDSAMQHEHANAEASTPTQYTCSMHPAIRLSDSSAKCPICFMALIPVEENAGSRSPTQLTLSESARAMSKIETAEVVEFFPTSKIQLYGKLVYDETSIARLSAYFPGRLNRLFVNYVGVPVNAGDHLAELYSPELIAAFAELRQAKQSSMNSSMKSEFIRETAELTLLAAREKLRLFGMTQEQIDGIESGEMDSESLTIYSPIKGVVTQLQTREGDYLDTGDPIATVSDLSRLWLDIEAYESQLPMLRWGLPVTFTVEAHPGKVFEGRISFIEPIIDNQTRTAAVRVAIDNTDMRLKPGMFASVIVEAKINADGVVPSNELAGKWVSPMHPTIVNDEQGKCDICGMDMVRAESLGIVGDPNQSVMPMVIPRSAVLFTGKRSIVYVQAPDQDEPTYEGRIVDIGGRAGEFYTIRSGLAKGEQVVVHGAFRIDSAMQILAKPSMMNQPESDDPESDKSRTVSQEFIESLSPIYNVYLDAQERLADDNYAGFIDSTLSIETALKGVHEHVLLGDQLERWRSAKRKLSSQSTISNIDQARIFFEQMSLAVLDLQEVFGHAESETLFTAFCPMAFDFEGAQWIQRGDQINNPYFGSEMLRCGDIQSSHEPSPQGMSPDEHKGHTDE